MEHADPFKLFIPYIENYFMDTLITENAAFFTVNRRSWTQKELAERLKELTTKAFEAYTDTSTPQGKLLNEYISTLPYFGFACAIYSDLYDRTLIYRTGQGDMELNEYEDAEKAYTDSEVSFFENPELNY